MCVVCMCMCVYVVCVYVVCVCVFGVCVCVYVRPVQNSSVHRIFIVVAHILTFSHSLIIHTIE